METGQTSNNGNKLNFSLDLRLLVIVLLIIITVMLAFWRPWQSRTTSTRTVQVTGQATLKAEPDQYVFNPSYEFSNVDKQTSLDQANAKSTELVKKLKELGVTNNNIKAATNSYGTFKPMDDSASAETTYSLMLTVNVESQELAQKVQDYLATTTPTGSVTPQPTFKTATRKSLESKARDQATTDARSKAEQNAKNLGFKLGSVKEVADGQGFSTLPYESATPALAVDGRSTSSAPSLQPGENEINYTITVTYYVK